MKKILVLLVMCLLSAVSFGNISAKLCTVHYSYVILDSGGNVLDSGNFDITGATCESALKSARDFVEEVVM